MYCWRQRPVKSLSKTVHVGKVYKFVTGHVFELISLCYVQGNFDSRQAPASQQMVSNANDIVCIVLCCCRLTDLIYRKILEVIEPLLKSLVYVWSDQEITSKLEQTTNFVNTKQWNKYVEFQGV